MREQGVFPRSLIHYFSQILAFSASIFAQAEACGCLQPSQLQPSHLLSF
jgi:hypothetical protein